jgi:hypothetical protein
VFEKFWDQAKLLGKQRVRVEISHSGDKCRVSSIGLSDAGLPEVEISSCPARLKDVASNLVRQVALNGLKEPASLAEGKTIGGRFANANQPLIEIFRLVRTEGDAAILRIADLQAGDAIFPYRLVATHLCAAAGSTRRDARRLLLVSIEVWPKEKVASNAVLGDFEFNPNNFWSWIDLGTSLAQANQTDDAIVHWKTAVCMWPRGGKLYAKRMLAKENSGWGGRDRLQQEFWQSVTDDAIKVWCKELDVELPEAALDD